MYLVDNIVVWVLGEKDEWQNNGRWTAIASKPQQSPEVNKINWTQRLRAFLDFINDMYLVIADRLTTAGKLNTSTSINYYYRIRPN